MKVENVKIYCYTSPSGKRYIGITKDIKARAGQNGSGYKNCSLFYKAILKYGFENMSLEILEDNLDYNTAFEKEKYYIAFYKTQNSEFGYNISAGGEAFFLGQHHSEATKQLLKEKNSGENNYWYGKHLSQETKNKIADKARKRNLGKGNPRYGVHLSDTTKRKISQTHKERKVSVGEKNPNFGRLGKDNPLSLAIFCYYNNEKREFIGIREAARVLNIPSPNIVRALSNPGKWSAGKDDYGNKIYWYYAESEEIHNEI